MRGGDISNETPPRIAVTEALLLNNSKQAVATRWMRRHVTPAVAQLDINRSMLARLWQYSHRNGISWELAIVGRPDNWGPVLMERLNQEGMHAFACTLIYPDYQAFARDLAWRSYLIGVVDDPERRLVYGGRYLDPGRIA